MAALLDAVLAVELDLALDVALAVELGLALDVALDAVLDVVLAALFGVKLVAWLSTLAAVESNAFCPPTTLAVVAYELTSCTMESGL